MQGLNAIYNLLRAQKIQNRKGVIEVQLSARGLTEGAQQRKIKSYEQFHLECAHFIFDARGR